LAMSTVVLFLFPPKDGLISHVRQLSWIQIALAGSVLLLEVGFLLMYRFGWNLSTGNLVTGVVVNLTLVALGTLLLGEKVNLFNILGIVLSIIGVALISYKN
jgi:drug/metabolite transporter (DMT)-like permease